MVAKAHHEELRRARVEAYADWAAITVVNHGLLSMIAFVALPPVLTAGAVLLLGIGLAMGGVTVLHNSGHRRHSRHYLPNMIVVHTAAPVGLWVAHWTLKHTVHHRLPAAYPDDSFTTASGVLRLHPSAPRFWFHRYQHWYIWVIYWLAWPVDLVSQLRFLVTGWVSGQDSSPSVAHRLGTFALERAASAVVLLPYLLFGMTTRFITALAVAVALGGFLAAVVVAIGHINVGLEYDRPDQKGQSWIRYVTATTASFSSDNRFLAWLTGSLTHHLAHHLRPVASRVELRAVHADLVARSAERSGPQLVEFATLAAALRGHQQALRELGRGHQGAAPTGAAPLATGARR